MKGTKAKATAAPSKTTSQAAAKSGGGPSASGQRNPAPTSKSNLLRTGMININVV